jgi:hypothetical protein
MSELFCPKDDDMRKCQNCAVLIHNGLCPLGKKTRNRTVYAGETNDLLPNDLRKKLDQKGKLEATTPGH